MLDPHSLLTTPIAGMLQEPQAPSAFQRVISELGWFDITAIGVLVVFFLLGMVKGVFWQVSRILSLAVAYVVSGLYGYAFADRIADWFSEANRQSHLHYYVAYFAVFLLALSVISLLAMLIERMVRKPEDRPSFGNRLVASALGLVTGAGVVLALVAAVSMFFGRDHSLVQAAKSSHSMNYSKWVIDQLGDRVPKTVQEVFDLAPRPVDPKSGTVEKPK